MSNQIWVDVAGRPQYQVTFDGLVRSKARMMPLAARADRDGYKKVTLCLPGGVRETTTVHKLVAITFHADSFKPGLQVRHLDGNPGNCRASNLAWGTAAENAKDREDHGRHAQGDDSCRAKVTDEQVVSALLKAVQVGMTRAAREIGISPAALYAVKNKESRAHLSARLERMGVI